MTATRQGRPGEQVRDASRNAEQPNPARALDGVTRDVICGESIYYRWRPIARAQSRQRFAHAVSTAANSFSTRA
jgi:hypothetical protein